ncbi:FCD domain-containing protein [Sphingomonas quercus]|uniref:FCD domain-containing protein n=1 Tax=Sphingomonas quercus TaxID=2842451 RepID=A0ABS6BGG2_9SPHN|nr:FCD domain-containing protein [Sphingomonas quercus]
MSNYPDETRRFTLPIKPIRLADTIAEHIQQLILEGVLQPGERLLAERELSAKLNVSRPSLREGLDRLIAEGLLTTNAQGATYVSENIGKSLRDPLIALMDNPDARTDLMELRAVVEAAAAGYAAERASDVNRSMLEERFNAMVKAHNEDDIDEIGRTDADFHFAIYESSHNIMMLHFMNSLEGVLRSSVYSNRQNLYKHRADRGSQIDEHRAIFEAIMDRDVAAAQSAAREHMKTALETQRAIYEAEKRLEASIRRLSRTDLVASRKRPKQIAGR